MVYVVGAQRLAERLERISRSSNNIPLKEGSSMSATDRLVEKNCKLVELRQLATKAVKTTPSASTSTPGNRVESNGRRRARLNFVSTRT
jgi:hypothetical protein